MNHSDLPDETLFERALSCRSPTERAAYLDHACAYSRAVHVWDLDGIRQRLRAMGFTAPGIAADEPSAGRKLRERPLNASKKFVVRRSTD